MLHFLQSLLHDLFVVGLTLLALLWGLGVRWAWRFLANGVLKRPALRAPAALLLWWVFWLVARFAVVQAALLAVAIGALLMHSGPVLAGDLVARQGDDSVRLTDQPCPIVGVIVERVPAGARGFLRLARAHFQGQDFTACWLQGDGLVFLLYEDGDQGVIPMDDLKPVSDI